MATDFLFMKGEEETRSKLNKKNRSQLTLSKHDFFRDLLKFHESRGYL